MSNLVGDSRANYLNMSLRVGISTLPLAPAVAHYIESLEMRVNELQDGLSGMITKQKDVLGSKRDLTVLTMQPTMMVNYIEQLLDKD